MTNFYPSSDNSSDNTFEQDLARLFDAFSEDGNGSASPSDMDDLADLFEAQDQFTELNTGFSMGIVDKFSTLPTEEEINRLFSDNLDWDEGVMDSSGWGNASDFDAGALANFSAGSDSVSEEELTDLLAQEEGSWEQLPMLIPMRLDLSEEPRVAEELSPVSSRQSSGASVAFAIADAWVESWDNLEALIDRPASAVLAHASDNRWVAELEAVIDAAVTVHQTEPSPIVPARSLDEGFKDLEYLLEEANRTMGGSPAGVGLSRSTMVSRTRSQKVKVFEQTMRVPVKQLDNLSNLIGELVVKRNRLEQDQERLGQFLDNLLNQVQNLSDVGGRMQDLHERTLLEGALLATRGQHRSVTLANNALATRIQDPSLKDDDGLGALEMDRFTGFHLLSQEMMELIVRVRESASDIQFLVDETEQVSRSLRQVTNQLQEGMTQSRMVPFSQTADRLPRAIREISLRLQKQAKLNVEGKEVLIDKVILEHLYNPMTHLVNNAITHGIESPKVRQQARKDPTGRITIRAFLQGNQTVITVTDDGAGIDGERVIAKAVEKGLITPEEAAIYSKQEVYDLLFHPGFSTKDKADDFSGRGVGLDVVRTSLIEIRGSVSIDSELGKGTTFTIRLPLTLSICKALGCISDHARIAFPMDGVEDMKNDYVPSDLILNEEGQRCIPWSNTLLPVYPLSELLSYNRHLSRGTVYGGKPEEDVLSIIVLHGAGHYLAVQVDKVIGEQEIVIKQIEGPVPRPTGIAGATVLGDGSIMPIGDVLELIELSLGRIRTDSSASLWKKTFIQSEQELKAEPTVLIVDDSITVRELLSSSFNKAGYRVEQARDGQEAWEKLRSGLPCNIVFCDIEMPRMNGLELLSNLQRDKRLSSIPVAFLTSRGDDRHRKVAGKLGASGYFTKPYTERDLIDAAQRMVRGEVLLPGSIKVSRYSDSEQDRETENRNRTHPGNEESALVLIIDDSVMVREMLSRTFSQAGYRVEQARDGQDAWEKLRSHFTCDLILCDIEMPRMNGLELLSRLQEDQSLSRIPIAMITSRGAQKMQRIAAERGAKGYFVKPYIEEVLLDSAKRLMAGEVLLDVNSIVE